MTGSRLEPRSSSWCSAIALAIAVALSACGSSSSGDCPGETCPGQPECPDGQCIVATCGNGVIDPGETCDQDCPTSCDARARCTVGVLTGNAATCTASCTYEPVSECKSGDGCCPAGCTTATDKDCSPSCGNGTVDPGETCDGNCPTSCDDGIACTADTLVGSAKTCSATCSHQKITACKSGDGCCPAGCTKATDADCSSACGNGVVDPGESCDGNCPSSCNDGKACTVDTLVGSASTCSAACSYQPISACKSGDGCCPAGCVAATDADCTPLPPLLQSYLIAPQYGGGGSDSLAYDSSGQPHVFYADLTDAVIRTAWRAGSTWQREVIDPDFAAGKKVVLGRVEGAISGAGAIHVVYARADQTTSPSAIELRYARRTATGWQISKLASAANFAFTLDAAGAPAVAWCDLASHNVVVGRLQGSAWGTQVVASGYASCSSAMAVASSTTGIWVAYVAGSSVSLAQPKAGGGWTVSASAMSGSYLNQLVLLVDASSTAHLLSGTTHVFGSGAFWSTETVPLAPGGAGPHYKLDAQGAINLAYRVTTSAGGSGSAKNFELRTARRTASGWVTTGNWSYNPGATVYSSTYWEPPLQDFDPQLRPVLLGPRPYGPQGLVLTEFDATSALPPVSVDEKERVIDRKAVMVDSTNKLHVAYFIEDQVRVATEGSATGSWPHPHLAVPKTMLDGYRFAIAVGSDGLARLAGTRYSAGKTEVKLVTEGAGGTLTSSTVPGSYFSGLAFVDLALDAQNHPHVIFLESGSSYSSAPLPLHHAVLEASGWVVSLVANVPQGYGPLSAKLVLDSQGNPFVAYEGNTDIYLARRQGGVWQSAKLAYDGNYFGFALAVDGANRPCVVHTPLDSTKGYQTTLSCLQSGSFVQSPIAASTDRYIVGAARDASGKIHVLAQQSLTIASSLTLHAQTATGWTSSSLGSYPSPAFAVGTAGVPRMVYFDSKQERLFDLRFAP